MGKWYFINKKDGKLNSLMIFVQQRFSIGYNNYLLSNGNNYKHIVIPAEITTHSIPQAIFSYRDSIRITCWIFID